MLIASGIRSHFVRPSPDAYRVIVREYSLQGERPMSGRSHGRRLPGEFVWSSHLEGSLLRAVFNETMDPTKLGFPPGYKPQRGDELPKRQLRIFTKLEPTDRLLPHDEALDVLTLTNSQLEKAQRFIEHGQAVIELALNAVGLSRRDGKCELAIDKDGNFIFIDSTGDPDNDRIGYLTAEGVWVDLSKQFLRDYFARIDYTALLKEAQKLHPFNSELWPDYPPEAIPKEVMDEASRRYNVVGCRYGLLEAA